jgi:hypothetical protein
VIASRWCDSGPPSPHRGHHQGARHPRGYRFVTLSELIQLERR